MVAGSPWRTVFPGLTSSVRPTGSTVTRTLDVAFLVPSVQIMSYVVVTVGDTVTEPDVAPPVENWLLVQDVAFVEVQLITGDVTPETITVGVTVMSVVGVSCNVPVTQVAFFDCAPEITVTVPDFTPEVL